MTEELFLKNLWLWKCGLEEIKVKNHPSLEVLKKTEWSDEFERLMRNRLIMGSFRYGLLNTKDKPKYDRMESVIKRATKYNQTYNKEFLVDIANLCLLEFEESDNGHFLAEDDKEHVNRRA